MNSAPVRMSESTSHVHLDRLPWQSVPSERISLDALVRRERGPNCGFPTRVAGPIHTDWHWSSGLVERGERPLGLLACSITCALYQQPVEAPLITPEPKTDGSALVTKHPYNPSLGVNALVGGMVPFYGFVMPECPAITSPLEAEVANAQAQGVWTTEPPVRLPEAGGMRTRKWPPSTQGRMLLRGEARRPGRLADGSWRIRNHTNGLPNQRIEVEID